MDKSNPKAPSYRDFVRSQCPRNPCISGLAQYLDSAPRGHPSIIYTIDYPKNEPSTPKPRAVPEKDLAQLLHSTSSIHGRILLVENIGCHLITLLGEMLDVEPLFFAGHVSTDLQDFEKAPPPPSLALFPSQIAERGHLHLHYQQVLDLHSADAFQDAPYNLRTDSNVPRNARRLPALSGRQLALARACCSVLAKKLQGSWICESEMSHHYHEGKI